MANPFNALGRGIQSINQSLENFSTNPLAMAGLGLLMQPSQSLTPINPWEYAARGMQMGIQNRRTQQEDKRRAEEYALAIEEYNRKKLKYEEQQARERERQDAFNAYAANLTPEQQAMARAVGPDYLKMIAQQSMGSSRLPAALIQEYEVAKSQGFPGTLMDYQREKTKLSQKPTPSQYIPTEQGLMTFDPYSKTFTLAQPGVLPASQSPPLQRAIAAEEAGGKLEGQRTTAARLDLPSYLDSSAAMLGKVEQLVRHPGMSAAVGAPSPGKIMGMVPGSEAANFKARLDEIRGGQFLEAFKTLRGGGAITQVEGEKATQAISRMNTSQSEEEFVKAANEFMDVVRRGMERAQMSAGQPAPVSAPNSVNFEDLP